MARRNIISGRSGGRRLSASTLLGNRTNRPDGREVRSFVEDQENFVLGRLRLRDDIDPARNGEYLHVSDLIHTCLRMKALTVRTRQRRHDRYVDESSGVTYAIGHAMQDYIIKRMKASNPGELYGLWKCACGQTEVKAIYQDAIAEVCHSCGTVPSNYNELRLVDDEYGITGSIDLSLMVDRAFYFTEIKSMKHELWLELAAIVPDHKIQIMFYYWLARRNAMPIHNKLSALYVSKNNTLFKSPFKEFGFDPRPEYERRLAPSLEEAAAYKAAVNDPAAPLPKKICSSPTGSQAKKCAMCALCFSMGD
jgi:hypothetical protein